MSRKSPHNEISYSEEMSGAGGVFPGDMTPRSEEVVTTEESGRGFAARGSLATAEALQATIRHADTKASILLGVAGGMMTTVSQAAVSSESHPALTGLVFAVTALGLAKAGWHLLVAIRPRVARWPKQAGSFDEELVELRLIALAKHSEVLRSIPWLVLTGVTTGVALCLAIADHLWLK